MEIKVNRNIPGWNTLNILAYLGKLVSELPSDANILEIGALFGRTSYVLAHNKPTTATLTTVDPWMTYLYEHFVNTTIHDNKCGQESIDLISKYTKHNPERIEGDDFLALWKIFVGTAPNHIIVREFSPVRNREWPMFDLIYHDGPHDGDDVYNDLSFWFPKLKTDGTFILDDYYQSQFPGLCEAVDKFVLENDLETKMVTERNISLRRKQ